jgi:hypothetical protein
MAGWLISSSENREMDATGLSGRACGDVLPMIRADRSDILRFRVQGKSDARRELNKLIQLFGSGKISKAKRETKSHSKKPGKQYLHFQEVKSLQSCSTATKKTFLNKKKKKKPKEFCMYITCVQCNCL